MRHRCSGWVSDAAGAADRSTSGRFSGIPQLRIGDDVKLWAGRNSCHVSGAGGTRSLSSVHAVLPAESRWERTVRDVQPAQK
ncbi:hypothetical protein D4764_08G0005420 [Takifugu flavidus]|uniref:Uncharacterized protein n=1 Tax=Takifugu flavidus TaxID=433684 RepID=A0A5C6MP91_9TELE|nr:hypothetical protein D4764_08G0005420 [Takifugu flavidus]